MDKHKRGLTAGSLTMMALGTVIGGSFFLGSAIAIHAAGPSIIISYVFGAVLVYFILYALSEMTVANPDSGSFRTFASQVFGDGAGFVVGWVYWTGMVLAMSSEATAAAILLRSWVPNISIALLGSAIIISVTVLNLLGADRLSRLESGLAAIKLFAIASFAIMAVLLITGLAFGGRAVGIGDIANEPFLAGGFGGLAGSMLVVMLSYSGFEIIGLAASEVENPGVTIPKAIRYTVISLATIFIVYILLLLPLIPTADLNENVSPIVVALNSHGIMWAGSALNAVLISAIISTMLATMFGLGRMMRSLTSDGLAPSWLNDKTNVPYRGILASGVGMLISLGIGLLFPRVYLFLISSGGFSILFTYAFIMASHIRFRRRYGCPPNGHCQLGGFPYTSIFVLVALIMAIISMPFVPGQSSGLIAGIIIVIFFSAAYAVMKVMGHRGKKVGPHFHDNNVKLSTEFSKELADPEDKEKAGGSDSGQGNQH